MTPGSLNCLMKEVKLAFPKVSNMRTCTLGGKVVIPYYASSRNSGFKYCPLHIYAFRIQCECRIVNYFFRSILADTRIKEAFYHFTLLLLPTHKMCKYILTQYCIGKLIGTL